MSRGCSLDIVKFTLGIQNGSFQRKYGLLIPVGGTNGTSWRIPKILPVLLVSMSDLSYSTFLLLVWIRVGQGPTALAVGAGGGCFGHFYSHLSFLFSFYLSLGADPI